MAVDWSAEYNYARTPEQNGFTRTIYNTPTLTFVSGGTPANRRVEIQSDTGDAVFLTSQVPSLDENIGVTCEATMSCIGAGDAGFELTFLNRSVLFMLYENQASLSFAQDAAPGQVEIIVPTASNAADTIIRVLVIAGSLTAYRNGLLLSGPHVLPVAVKPFQRVLWWGESGGLQTFKAMRYYSGGAVAP